MIADRALAAVQTWIESRNGTYPDVDEWTIAQPGKDANKNYPLLTLSVSGAEEHETLRGVMAPLTISASLETIAHADGADASATTEAEHQSYSSSLYNIIADQSAVSFMDAISGIHVWDSRGHTGSTLVEDGRRATTFEINLTCANQ